MQQIFNLISQNYWYFLIFVVVMFVLVLCTIFIAFAVFSGYQTDRHKEKMEELRLRIELEEVQQGNGKHISQARYKEITAPKDADWNEQPVTYEHSYDQGEKERNKPMQQM